MKGVIKNWLPQKIMENTAELMEKNGIAAGNVSRSQLETIINNCIAQARQLDADRRQEAPVTPDVAPAVRS